MTDTQDAAHGAPVLAALGNKVLMAQVLESHKQEEAGASGEPWSKAPVYLLAYPDVLRCSGCGEQKANWQAGKRYYCDLCLDERGLAKWTDTALNRAQAAWRTSRGLAVPQMGVGS